MKVANQVKREVTQVGFVSLVVLIKNFGLEDEFDFAKLEILYDEFGRD